jgi:hypothetical protein
MTFIRTTTFFYRKESLMQARSQFSLDVLLLALVCAGSAFAQADAPEAGITRQQAESYAKMIFREDIGAGRVTVQQAGALFKCANERYTRKLTPEMAGELFEATRVLSEHQDRGTPLSDAKKAQYGRAYKDAGRLQREAEDSCRQELGIDPSVERVFRGFGTQRK